ncbi:alpha/beta hydrolase family esterase [Gemmatimonas sp.]|jgi:polyhydroxybutyrate depolymerase|uniref:alpha/beta hydrolase family esterase n=1 Tax=Gemmatimonas sp. TaxID=1962908 RepID=UPI0037C05588
MLPLITQGCRRLARLAAAVLPTLAVGCANGANGAATAPTTPPAPYPVGLSDHSLTVAGVARQYRVHVPTALAGAPRAIVLVLHGGGGAGLDVANTGAHPLSVFRTVADRERFVVVYPGGLPATDGNVGWVDCRRDNRNGTTADDEGFLAALIERVRAAYNLSASAVFMAGGSNGAMMTHAFAMARPDLVAGVATSSGSLAADPLPGACSAGATVPVPIVMVHGTADTQMPYAGGCVADLGGGCNRGRVVSAEATRDRWLRANGLIGVQPTVQVIDPVPNDGGPANRFDYAGPVPVQWWRLDGAGHTVASRSVLVAPNTLSGIQSRDIEFAEVAWAFFAARLR